MADSSDEQPSTRQAFLLTWNPNNWEWTDLPQSVYATGEGQLVDERWSTGSRTSGIQPGDLVFLLRQGEEPRGIIGSGEAVDFYGEGAISGEIIYTDQHWDGTDRTANYVNVLWNRLVDPEDGLRLEELQAEFPDQHWTPFSSGTEIKPELVAALQDKWSDHVRSAIEPRGQGFVAAAVRRKAIEDAAQDWLMQHYRDDGWTVTDTRYSGPYDAVARRGDETLYLEAKGTQGDGTSVFLTRGEVEHARRNRGSCIIGIWSGMQFTDDETIDQDVGETLIMPFDPDSGTLSALQYRWELGDID